MLAAARAATLRPKKGVYMQRIAFMMQIKPGAEEEYRRRHQQVWPELLADLEAAGCHNYSIFTRGDDLFAYMEVDDFARFKQRMAESAADRRWQTYMNEIMVKELDPAIGFPYVLPEVFHID